MKKILCIIGTRPEAIKMAPIILALKKNASVEVKVLATAQHRQLLDQVLSIFEIKPDIDLDIMLPNQSLSTLTGRLLLELDTVFINEKPDVVLAQGDTTTVMTAALTCFYHNIAFGHVEAGLRTWDLSNPFPEEMNRVIAGKFAKWHFAPTDTARQNLLKESINDSKIHVTGNTVIDALFSVKNNEVKLPFSIDKEKKLILVTAHRRENFGSPFTEICEAILAIAERNEEVQIIFPVHPNPNIKEAANRILGDHPRILLSPPLEYLSFIATMKQSYCILSDSGGVQEEAPALGKPVLVLREETERPEALMEGVIKLVGTNKETIINETEKLLYDKNAYAAMARGVSPYGDGLAAMRISNVITGNN